MNNKLGVQWGKTAKPEKQDGINAWPDMDAG